VRVSITHREEAGGLFGAKRHYYIDGEVLFSEEEKAIIAARGLAKHTLTVDPAVPPPAPVHYMSASLLRGFAPLLLVASCGIGIGLNGPLGDFLAMVAIGMFIASFVIKRKTTIAEQPRQVLTLQGLMDYPRVTIYALDPAEAKSTDDGLRSKLAGIKGLLVESTEIRSKETFEL